MNESAKDGLCNSRLARSDQQDWITRRIADSKAAHSTITDAVVNRIETVLRGNLQESSLSTTYLNTLAKNLLKDMLPLQPKPEDTE